uniref:UDP glucuronosyltransferase 5 family, polypeptide D1 n=1 Tax=Echeneis naucrates TaxID=173247 RepID=A0A665VLQ5_ECHNA
MFSPSLCGPPVGVSECSSLSVFLVPFRAVLVEKVRILTLVGICLISFTTPCYGGNILVFPVDGSHWINMKVLVEELHARGHNITVIRGSTSWYIAEKSPLYTSITVELVLTFLKLNNAFMSMINNVHILWCEVLEKIFDDDNLFKILIDSRYDLVLTDPALAAGVVLAKYLKLPLVLNVRWIPSGEGHFAVAPSPLSYIPVPGSGLTDKMDFMQRIKNLFFHSIIVLHQKFVLGPHYDALCDKYIEGGCDVFSLLQEADIWLFRSDFVFDFPRPTMPNIVYIGGFQCKPAQPLSAGVSLRHIMVNFLLTINSDSHY